MANPILQLLEALRNMFTCDIGIDLGTANTLVYMKGRGIIIREPSVVAVDARTDELRVRCVGHEAKAIIGAAPNSILAPPCCKALSARHAAAACSCGRAWSSACRPA